jgi:hypothetical protein
MPTTITLAARPKWQRQFTSPPPKRHGLQAKPRTRPLHPLATVKSRLKILAYDSGPYLGFDESEDIHGDGTIVVVLLPVTTPA